MLPLLLCLATLLGGFRSVPLEDAQRLLDAHAKDVERLLQKRGYNGVSEVWTAVRAERQTVHGVNHRLTVHDARDATYCVRLYTDLAKVTVVEEVLPHACDDDRDDTA